MNDAQTSPAALMVEEYLGRLRGQFYADLPPKVFFQQKHLLMQAVGYPADFVKNLGVLLPLERYREILDEVVKGIKHHGATDKIQHFGVYFLQCVQSHMKVRQEHYYEEGKIGRAKLFKDHDPRKILDKYKVGESPAEVTDTLAEFARLSRSGPRKGQKQAKKAAKQTDQLSLFK